MNYHQYYPVDIVNGPGTRCTLFVSGCVHECPGCYNKSTWRVNSGMPFTAEMADRIIADLNDTRIKRQGISLSGGDPLHPQNVAEILKLVQRVRAECPGKDIWVWTGYKLDELNEAQMRVVNLINVLVDGKFVQDLKRPGADLARQQQPGGTSFALIPSVSLSKPADALHRHRFKLIEAAGRGKAAHGALAQESHENIVDRHRLFVLALTDGEQENDMGGFVAPGDALRGDNRINHRLFWPAVPGSAAAQCHRRAWC